MSLKESDSVLLRWEAALGHSTAAEGHLTGGTAAPAFKSNPGLRTVRFEKIVLLYLFPTE